MSELTPAAVEALTTTLAAEHAAVFVYGALGARTSTSAQPALSSRITATYRVHQDRRDHLMALLTSAGQDAVAAQPGYDLPADLDSPARIQAHAVTVEQATVGTYLALVAHTVDDLRRWAVQGTVDAAVRIVTFGGTAERLPGL